MNTVEVILHCKNKLCIPFQLVYHITLCSVNYPNYNVIGSQQCYITHHIFTAYRSIHVTISNFSIHRLKLKATVTVTQHYLVVFGLL